MTRGPSAPPASTGRRRLLGVLAALGGVNGVGDARAGPDAPAAGWRLPDASGRLRPLHDGLAAATWVDFWASWCAPCRQSFPWMNDLHDRLSPQGLRVVAVNLDTRREDADRFLARLPARFEVLFDAAGDTGRRFDVRAMPSSLLLDAAGAIAWRHAGFRPSEAPALEARIRSALPPAPRRTAAIDRP